MLAVLAISLAGGYFWYDDQQQPTISPLTNDQVHAQTIVISSPISDMPDETPMASDGTTQGDQNLQQKIAEIELTANATYGIAIKNLKTGETYYENAKDSFTMASTYKPPVILTALQDIESGKLDANKKISYWTVIPAADLVITRSEEDLAEQIADIVTWNKVQQTASNMGMKQTFFDKRFATTPEDQMMFMERLYKSQGVSQKVRDQLYDMLLRQQINDRLPKYLPAGTQVAHKTGELDDLRHDVGIVTAGDQVYVIALMSKDAGSPEAVKEALAKISLAVYTHFTE